MLIHGCVLIKNTSKTVHSAQVLSGGIAKDGQLVVTRRELDIYEIDIANLFTLDRPLP